MGYLRLTRVVPARPRLGVGGLGQIGQGLSIEHRTIPDGDKGTAATITEMGRLSVAAAHDPKFVSWVRGQVADLKSKDYVGEAKRIFEIVHNHVRYVQDPLGLEVVQDPRAVLFRDGSGDCDEHASTVAAMALALGHRAAFRTVAADYDRPDQWSHVYALIGVQDPSQPDGIAWYPADTTQRRATLGWEPPLGRVWKKKDWVVG
ncbi:MAG: transglutaminase domain-containing protein [Deltaproteobacteria bacterium]|nr:transglutaminase domain-containing protein [Deltaproteobacteria bacterium]